MDLSKRALLLGTREVRGMLDGGLGADWTGLVSCRAMDVETDPDFWTFSGEASVVDWPYTVRDMFGEFTETIRAGAFDKTLSENPLVMLNFMHNPETTMVTTARSASDPQGGLTLSASPNLTVAARIPRSDPDAQRIMPKVMRGDAASMSFAFRVMQQTWNDDYTDRGISEVNLNKGDVASIVTGLGASPAAWGTVRHTGEITPLVGNLAVERVEVTPEPDLDPEFLTRRREFLRDCVELQLLSQTSAR